MCIAGSSGSGARPFSVRSILSSGHRRKAVVATSHKVLLILLRFLPDWVVVDPCLSATEHHF